MELREIIAGQIAGSGDLNLLYRNGDLKFAFSDAVKKLLQLIAGGHLTRSETDDLVQYTCEAALSSFYRVNQYYQFHEKAVAALRQVYVLLVDEVRQMDLSDFEHLARNHFTRLQQWLLTYEPDAAMIFPADAERIKNKVVCAEYSATLQLYTLQIQPDVLLSPILDIGCGRKLSLVHHLQELGFQVCGIDRDVEPGLHVQRADWLHYDYGQNHWGSIISHLGFTNHFRFQHLNPNGKSTEYARTFMAILHALKPGGTFYYTPDLPFIETFLDPQQFKIRKQRVADTGFTSVAIQKIR